jgi:hypothetical protein
LNSLGLGVQRACDRHLFSRELFGRPLVVQRIDFLSVIQSVLGTVRIDAGNGALGVRPILIRRIGRGAHAVRNGAGDVPAARSCGHCLNYKKTKEQKLHNRSFT